VLNVDAKKIKLTSKNVGGEILDEFTLAKGKLK